MSSVKSSEPNRLALLAAKLLRSVSAIAAVIAGSIGSP